MAITFLEKRKRLKFLIPIALVLIVSSGIVIWRGFFGKPKVSLVFPVPEAVVSGQKIDINFAALKNPILEKLELFEGVSAFEGNLGRGNPFLSY